MTPLLASLGLAVHVLAASAPRAPTILDAAPQSSALGGVTLDLGSQQHLVIEKDGNLWLDGALMALGNLGLEPYANTVAHRLTRDRVTVAVGIQIPHMRAPDSVLLAEIDLLEDRLVWSAEVSPPTLTVDQGSSWSVVFGDRITLLQREHVLVAIDMRTGTQAWSFANAAPSFEADYHGALRIDILDTQVRGRDVLVEAKRRGSGQALHIVLDLVTGRRVDARRAPAARELFGFSEHLPAPVLDGPRPPPPPPPEDFDGLIFGYTTLVWNTKTARGIVVNPTADALGDIVALARKQHVTDADGTSRPVQWVLAIDTDTLATELGVGKVPRPRKPSASPTIWFDYDDGLQESGEVVDVDGFAAALGVPALRSRVDLRDVPSDVRVGQQEFGALELVFGAVGFTCDTQRWAENHVRRP
jgi:hypothetical protein